jgi:superfamily II DNA or RNA helicase
MSERGLPELTLTAIRGFVGSHTYDKGRAYQAAGLVVRLEIEEDRPGMWLVLASVNGSGREPYEVIVTCRMRGGSLAPVSSDCSCPMGLSCKHVAAALIEFAARRDRLTPAKTDWRAGIQALLPDNTSVETAASAKIALLFEIRREQQFGYYYGSRPKSDTALTVRIGAPSPATGKWVQNQFSWQDIAGKTYRSDRIAPAQREILQTLWSLYELCSRGNYNAYDGWTVIRFDNFNSGRIWRLLDEARAGGIPLLTTANGNPPVELRSTCGIELDISEQSSGDLQLAPQFVIDGRSAAAGVEPHIVGDPPIGAYWARGPAGSLKQQSVFLARFAEPPESFLLKAFQDKTRLDVPAKDKEEFSRAYFPRLARRGPVSTKRVRTIKLEAPELPKLYLSVGRAKPQGVRVHTGFAYQENDAQTIMPYRADGDPAIIRDAVAEQRLIEKMSSKVAGNPAWFEEIPGPIDGTLATLLRPDVTLHGLDAVRFVTETVPELRTSKDTVVQLDADVPQYRELQGAPSIAYEVSKRDGDGSQDWFNLGIEVTVGDVTIPFEPLFAALAENETSLMLDDGRYLMLTHPELLKLRQLIIEARQLSDKTSDELSISRFQAGLWDELQQLGVVKAQSEAWESAVRGLLDVREVPKVRVPKNLKATLRPYQKEGFQWLHFLWTHRLGGILADDMGLGKTLQTIALILAVKAATAAKDRRPALIIAPTSVAANWQSELAHFAPTLKVAYVRKVAGSAKELAGQVRRADVVVGSYGLFRLNFDAYAAQTWMMLILDEAQFVKNHQSKGYQNARKLPADFKLALTGTPLENNLMELWALLSIVAPGLFPSPKHFGDFYQKPIERDADNAKLKQLRARVRPLMLRRTKEQVVRDLPPKIEQVIELELEPRHRKVYDTYLQRERQRVLGLLGDMDKNRFIIFKSITTLRLLSLAPSLVDAKKYAKVPATKLSALREQLQEVLGENHRVLIFSQFTSFLKMVQVDLRAQNIHHCYLDGSTKNRADLLEEFKTSGAPVFLISLKAGGFGLNLTEADYCILLDPWWNPAAETQAVDRTHRIGQTKQVIVYRLVAQNTIEEKVMALKAKKSKLFTSMLDENAAFSSKITADDIQQLFS